MSSAGTKPPVIAEPDSDLLPEPTPEREPPTPPPTPPPGWLRWPARVVAVAIVLPLRLVWEALVSAARGTVRLSGGLLVGQVGSAVLRAGCAVLRAARSAVLEVGGVLGAAFAWVGRGVLAVLRALGRALTAAGRWVSRLLRHGLRGLGRLLLAPLVLLWRWVLLTMIIAVAIAVVGVVQGAWRFLRWPLLRAIAATWGALGRGLTELGRLAPLLALLGRAAVVPFVWLRRFTLAPIGSPSPGPGTSATDSSCCSAERSPSRSCGPTATCWRRRGTPYALSGGRASPPRRAPCVALSRPHGRHCGRRR